MSKKNRRNHASPQGSHGHTELYPGEVTLPGFDADSGDADELEAEPETVVFRYFLGPRKSVITRGRGIVHDPGAELFSDDFSSGQSRLEDLVAAGVLVKR